MTQTYPRSKRALVALLVTTAALFATLLIPSAAEPAAGQGDPTARRWLQIDSSVLRTTVESQPNPQARLDAPRFRQSYLNLIAKADEYGYNGVLIRGGELNALERIEGTTRYTGRDPGFVRAVQDIAKAARDRNMEVVFTVGSIGRCNPVLAPNGEFDLATAYPVTMAMRNNGGTIVPARSITLDGTLRNRTIQGQGSATTSVSGLERGGQYRVTVRLQSELNRTPTLADGTISLQVVDPTTGQLLNRVVLGTPETPTTTNMTIAFNSFLATSAIVQVEAAKNRDGLPLSITEYAVASVPLLNGLNRDGRIGSRPALALDVIRDGRVIQTRTLNSGLRLQAADGTSVQRDPLLGKWDSVVSSWSAAHTPPTLRLDVAIPPHDSLRLRGWHALPNTKTVACSWNDPAMSNLIGRIARYIVDDYQASGIVLPFDEINSGGAEPADGMGSNPTRALANSVANNVGAVRRAVGGGTPIYMFNDMIDRNVNARKCYVHVVGPLDREGDIRVPNNVTVLTWDESGVGDQHFIRDDLNCGVTRGTEKPGFNIATHRGESLDNMGELADQQMVTAYYDIDDIAADHRDWQLALNQSDATNVEGVIYSTWENPGKCPAYPDQTSVPLRCDKPCDAATERAERARPTGRCESQCKDNLELRGCAFEHLDEFSDLWWGPPVDDRVCEGRVPTRVGTAGDDVIRGTAGDDVIWAGNGNDVVYAFGGNDVICGGQGDDRIFAADGDDRIFAGPGADTVYAGAGRDALFGGGDDDRLWGGPGNDEIYGGDHVDYVAGGPGDDQLFGGPGDDLLLGGADSDRLNGGPDQDFCHGGGGRDVHVGNCERLRETP